MHILFLYFCFIFCSFTAGIKTIIQPAHIKIGHKIYLNGVGGKGESYFTTPLKIKHIEECPNIVTALEKSSYGRPFLTKSFLTLDIQGQKITATLDNFRNLLVTNERGTVLLKQKISGATSLYKITRDDHVIAFGVGWNKSEDQRVDFTTFRVFLPIICDNEITINQKLFNGLSQSSYEKLFHNDQATVLIEARSIGCGAVGLYYFLPEFVALDNVDGFKIINSFKELKKYTDFNDKKLIPLFLWLINKKESDDFKIFMKKNIDLFFQNEVTHLDMIHFSADNKNKCHSAIEKFEGPFSEETLMPIFNQCLDLPEDSKHFAFSMWIEDLLARN
ncbi:MAG: hypothetical protein HEEMFOPI_01746 [Holosporales bacterium]